MSYADDAAVASQSHEQLRTMTIVIVSLSAPFVLTSLESKIEIICLVRRGSAVHGIIWFVHLWRTATPGAFS